MAHDILSLYDYEDNFDVPPRTAFSDDYAPSLGFSNDLQLQSSPRRLGTSQTTNNSTFTWKSPELNRKMNRDRYTPSIHPFDDQTTHKAFYQPIAVEPTRKIANENRYEASQDIPFHSETTHDSTYTYKEIDNLYRPSQNHSYTPSTVPFYSQTTHQEEFVPKIIPKRTVTSTQMQTISQNPLPSTIRFDDLTTNKMEYTPKEIVIEKRAQPANNTSAPSNIKFEDQTTNRAVYTPKQVEKVEKVINRNTIYSSDNVFHSTTTNKEHFQKIEVERQKPIRRAQTLGNDGDALDSMTTHQFFYQPVQGEKAKSIKKPSSLEFKGDFEKTTMNQQMFKAYNTEQQKPIKQTASLRSNTDKFEGNTTHQIDFQPKLVAKQTQLRVNDNELFGKNKEVFKTETIDAFQAKTVHRCPAEALQAKRGNARHVNGHLFFRQKRK